MFHQRRHNIGLLVLAVAAGIAATIALAEFAVRILFPERVPATERVTLFQYDPLLGWSHRPGQRIRLAQRDFNVDVSINDLGLRDDEYAEQKGDKRRLLVVGDSFAWGFGVEHGERFTEALEQTHSDWEVINAAVPGYGTDQQLLYLRDRGLRLQPDVVLLLFHPNDFENNLASEQYWYYKPQFTVDGRDITLGNVPVPRATLAQKMRRVILGRTYLGQALLVLWRRMKPAATPSSAHDPAFAAGAALTTRLVHEMNRLCRRHGSRLVIVSVPMSGHERSVLNEVVFDGGILYLALDSTFASLGSGRQVTFPHDEHWTAYGHAVAAESTDKFLIESGVFAGEAGLD